MTRVKSSSCGCWRQRRRHNILALFPHPYLPVYPSDPFAFATASAVPRPAGSWVQRTWRGSPGHNSGSYPTFLRLYRWCQRGYCTGYTNRTHADGLEWSREDLGPYFSPLRRKRVIDGRCDRAH